MTVDVRLEPSRRGVPQKGAVSSGSLINPHSGGRGSGSNPCPERGSMFSATTAPATLSPRIMSGTPRAAPPPRRWWWIYFRPVLALFGECPSRSGPPRHPKSKNMIRLVGILLRSHLPAHWGPGKKSTFTKQEFDSVAHMDLTITLCFVMVLIFTGLPGWVRWGVRWEVPPGVRWAPDCFPKPKVSRWAKDSVSKATRAA